MIKYIFYVLYAIIYFTFTVSPAFGKDDPISRLANDTMLFFKPVSGKIIRTEGDAVYAQIRGMVTADVGLDITFGTEPTNKPTSSKL